MTLRRIIGSPYLQLGGPLVVAGVGELLRQRGVSLGVFLIVIGLVIFALAGLEQLRLRLTFRRGPLGFDIYFRWRADSSRAAMPVPVSTTSDAPALIAKSPTMIARPLGLGQPIASDIEVTILGHEWYSDPAGKQILKVRIRIHNTHQAATRTIAQHWFRFAGYAKGIGERLSLQNPGVSQWVGPVKTGETLEGDIYTTLPSAPNPGPNFDLYIQDELGHEARAKKE